MSTAPTPSTGVRAMGINPRVTEIDERIIDVLRHRIGKDERAAKPHDWFTATVLALRDKVIDQWMDSTHRTYEAAGKRVYYLSLEFLIGRLLRDALSNMGLTREMEAALRAHGLDLAALEELEPDAALGNGGLGRLAACFMESLASLGIPAYGVCSLDAIALQVVDEALCDQAFAIVTDARRREVYAATYDAAGLRLTGPDVLPARELSAATRQGPVFGIGGALYADEFTDVRAPEFVSAAWLGRVVVEHPDRVTDTTPLYLRRPDAVENASRKRVTPA